MLIYGFVWRGPQMDTNVALSQVRETLYRLRALDLDLRSKITDDHIQRYVDFCRRDDELLACPVCFLSKGKVSYMHPGLPQMLPGTEDLICDYCNTHIPISLPSQNVA